MRQGQNNSKRSRGRGRKPQNSGNRAYDSNGPDVKIRGTAAHVCEKYQQLARDAISAGDRVMAENYYQHAEHYYRLLMASQVMNEGQPRPQHNLGYRPDEDQDEEEEDFSPEQPQPHFPNQPYHQQSQQHAPRQGRGDGRGERGERHQNPNAGQQPQGELEAQSGADDQPVVAEDEARGDGYAQGIPGGVSGAEGPRRRQGRRRRPRHEAGGERQASEGGESAAPSSVDEAPAV